MAQALTGKKIMILVSNGVDESVMSEIQRELLKSGAMVKTVGTEPGLVNSWNDNAWGLYFPVDIQISQALGADYDMLVVPSGSRSVIKLNTNPHTERILSSFIAGEKKMCFIGDGIEVLKNVAEVDFADAPHIMTGDAMGAAPAFVQAMIAFMAGTSDATKVAA